MTLGFDKKHSLQSQNSLGVPSVCDTYIEVIDRNQITPVIEYASQNKLSIFVLGEGSNLVLHQSLAGLVIKTGILGKEIIAEDDVQVRLRIGAGENWHDLVTWTLEQGYFGLENLALIPGSCGAAPVQNIGAYGVEISRYIKTVEYVDLVTRIPEILFNEECLFGYRDSIFKNDLANRVLITHIELCLSKVPTVEQGYPALAQYLEDEGIPATPQGIYQAVCAVRSSKLPDIKDIPNVGSFFKNPIISNEDYERLLQNYPQLPGYPQLYEDMSDITDIKIPAAWLIDKLGWKGKSKDGVGVHNKQALVIVNPGHRKGEQVLAFAGRIMKNVEEEFGISLEIEPSIVVS